jgi:hypothetical protein
MDTNELKNELIIAQDRLIDTFMKYMYGGMGALVEIEVEEQVLEIDKLKFDLKINLLNENKG